MSRMVGWMGQLCRVLTGISTVGGLLGWDDSCPQQAMVTDLQDGLGNGNFTLFSSRLFPAVTPCRGYNWCNASR